MRLTKAEALTFRSNLQAWQTPLAFESYLHVIRSDRLGDLLIDARAGFYRDAYVASRFSRALHATEVRLLADDRPDFEIRSSRETLAFEVTEADSDGRRRGDEIREALATVGPDISGIPSDSWAEPKQVFNMLAKAAKNKSSSKYNPTWGLIIYLNQWEFFAAENSTIEDVMLEATQVARSFFAEIWILWGKTLYLRWNNGSPCVTKVACP